MPRKQTIEKQEARRITEIQNSLSKKDLSQIINKQREAEMMMVIVKIDPRTTVMCHPEKVPEIWQKYGV